MISQPTDGGRGVKQQQGYYIRRENLKHFSRESRISIRVNAEPLEPADAFPYLSRTIVYNNSDWAAVYHNLRKAQ